MNGWIVCEECQFISSHNIYLCTHKQWVTDHIPEDRGSSARIVDYLNYEGQRSPIACHVKENRKIIC